MIKSERIKCLIDEVGYKSKPDNIGAITNRLNNTIKSKKEIPLQELADLIITGHTFCPSHSENGTKDEHFTGANSIFLDFDNKDKDGIFADPMSPERAKTIAKLHGFTINILYWSFSNNTSPVDKFRIGFVLDRTITDPMEYKQAIQGLQSIYGKYADKAVTDAVQRLYGTCNGLVEPLDCSVNNVDDILKLYSSRVLPLQAKKTPSSTLQLTQRPTVQVDEFDLTQAINDFNLHAYILSTEYVEKEYRGGNGTFIDPCPICGGHRDFNYIGNTYVCKVKGQGGNHIISCLMQRHGLDKIGAVKMFKYDIMKVDYEAEKEAYKFMKQSEQAKQAVTNGLIFNEKTGLPSFIYPLCDKRTGNITRYAV